MLIFKNKLGFIVVLIFLSSCTSMNITEENVYSDNVKTVEASSESLESIQLAKENDFNTQKRFINR